MAARIDLNCDLGESFGRYKLGEDEKVIPLISSANVACGFHAGDPLVMRRTVALAKEAGISIGAHPGLPDLQGFGRRTMRLSQEEAYSFVLYQVGALQAICRAQGTTLAHVKPHGALYNQCSVDYNLSTAVVRAIMDVDPGLVLVGLANGELVRAGQDLGIRVAQEFFVDRNYDERGLLRDRSLPGALITDEDLAVERLKRVILEGTLETYEGSTIQLHADTVCVHGDGAKALEFARRIRMDLTAAGIEIRPMGDAS